MDAERIPIALAQTIPNLSADTVVTWGFIGALVGAVGLALKVKGWIERSGVNAAAAIEKRIDEEMGNLRNEQQRTQSEIRVLSERQAAHERHVQAQFVSVDRFEAFEIRVDRRLDSFHNDMAESRKERDRKLDNIQASITRIFEKLAGHG